MARYFEYCDSKKYSIHTISKDMVYALSNFGYQGFIFGKCVCELDKYVDELIDSLDFLIKENKKTFLYHPLLLEEKNPNWTERDSYLVPKTIYSLLFLFDETTSNDIIKKTFQHLAEYKEKIKKENKYYFNNIRVLRADIYTEGFIPYIEKKYASYIHILMSMINETYEETRLEEYKESLKTGRNLNMFSDEKKRLFREIKDFFNNKKFARYAMMQRDYNVLFDENSFNHKLILLQRYNFCHYKNNPLKFDLSTFDTMEDEFSYKKNMSTLKRINNVSCMSEIIPYAASALYETESGEDVISQIKCSFEISPQMMIPKFMITEYAYSQKEVKFRRCLDIDSVEFHIGCFDERKYFILCMIMKMAYTAREYGLTMKKIKIFSYDYHLLFNVHTDTRAYLCKKPLRRNDWKTEQAKIFFETFENVSYLKNLILERIKEVDKLNKEHKKEWENEKRRHKDELEAKKRAIYCNNQNNYSSNEKAGYHWSVWTPFFNESDYQDYYMSKQIEKVYKTCENYRKRN